MKIQSRYEYDPARDLLGKGGFARVFRAQDTLLDRVVALKVFNTTALHNYSVLQEIKKVIQLEHPNLLRYYDVLLMEQVNALGEKEQLQIGVMEYANAGDLKDFARKNPGSPLLYKLLKDVLHGLEYLHSKGVIHRDLKAQNILLVNQDGQLTAKISDFGISKDTNAGGQQSSMLAGTPEYMAPEQFNADKFGIDGKVSSNLDLWSFGIMVHELLTGTTPYGNEDGTTTYGEVLERIMRSEQPEGVEKLPEPYRSVVKRCLVINAKERIRRANELLRYFDGDAQAQPAWTPPDEAVTKVYPKGAMGASSQPRRDDDATKVYPKGATPSSGVRPARQPDDAARTYGEKVRAERQIDEGGTSGKNRKALITGVAALVLLALGGGGWYLGDQRANIEAQVKADAEAKAEAQARAEAQAESEARIKEAQKLAVVAAASPSTFEEFERAIRGEKDSARKSELKVEARRLIGSRLDFGVVHDVDSTWATTYKFIGYDPVANVLTLDEDATHVSANVKKTSSARVSIFLSRVDRIKDYSDSFEIGCPLAEDCIRAAFMRSDCGALSKPSRCVIFSYAAVLPQSGGTQTRMSEFKNVLNKIIYRIDGRPAI